MAAHMYAGIQSMLTLIMFSTVFVVFVWMTSKTAMAVKDYISAFALGAIVSVLLYTGGDLVGTGLAKGILKGVDNRTININYTKSRSSTLEDSDGQRSREH